MNIREKILVVEDEKTISHFISTILNTNGYEAMQARSGSEALSMISSHCPDLIILDLGLPDMDGLEILRRLREWSSLPVVVVSARSHERDKVTALDLGADDYLTKPFNPLELVARVKAQLRRYTRYNEAEKAAAGDVIDFNGLVINRATHECTLYEQPLGLTPIEFDILWMLCENRGQVISAERLFETVWGEKYLDRNNTVMVHIRRLREKMGEPSRNPRFIKTVWGVGYKVD